jgi:ribokinase
MIAMLVVLGNAGRDLTYRVGALPRPGETVIAENAASDLGGKGLNQAIMARRTGIGVRFIAPVGRDSVAEQIRSQLAVEGIDDSDLIAKDGASDSSVVLIDAHGENAIVSDTRQVEALTPGQVVPVLKLGPKNALLLQGNLSRDTTAAAIAAGNAVGATVILNAAPMRPWLSQLPGRIDVLIANRIEASEWVGLKERHVLADIIASINVPLVVITLGAEGCHIRRQGDIDRAISAPQTNAVDTTGAGDTFVGAFVADWLVHGDPTSAAMLGVHAASDKVTRDGTVSALPTTATISMLRARLMTAECRPPST